MKEIDENEEIQVRCATLFHKNHKGKKYSCDNKFSITLKDCIPIIVRNKENCREKVGYYYRCPKCQYLWGFTLSRIAKNNSGYYLSIQDVEE